ncbi:putative iron-sulfur flavoprotein [[Clostridium] sordellii ATCC 9714]|nr:putative iron-sulfur flavoprotein [[Clostridium] sordellii ATCC 9714] [Paeniclostridium sordellii ATCC 9714]
MYIAVGGSSPYQSQFKGGQIVMDFFFKSINTKLTYNYYLNNSDKVAFIENNQAIKDLKKYITNYIKDIKELG